MQVRRHRAVMALLSSMATAVCTAQSVTPWAVVVDEAAHRFYVVDPAANRVVAVATDGSGVQAVPVGARPIALALDVAAHQLYAVNSGSGTVSVIDTATLTVMATAPTDRHPYAIAVDTATHRAYVSNTFSNKLTVVDGRTGTSRQLPLGSKDALLCDPVRHALYMIGYEDTTLARLDLQTEQMSRLPAANHLWSMALAPDGRVKVVSVGNGSLLTVSPGAAVSTERVGAFPAAVALDGATVVVPSLTADTVSIVGEQGTATVPVGHGPRAVAVDPVHHLAYVVNTHSGTVSLINITSKKVAATKAAGKAPYAIAVDLASGTALVANMTDGGNTAPAYTLIRR